MAIPFDMVGPSGAIDFAARSAINSLQDDLTIVVQTEDHRRGKFQPLELRAAAPPCRSYTMVRNGGVGARKPIATNGVSVLERTSVLLANIPDAEELLGLADTMAAVGFGRVWLAETGGLDVSALGAVIARTTPLEVGTCIVPVYSRSPALLSMMASTISHLGRARRVNLGIGAGGQFIVEDWHGLPQEKPAMITRETISILRQALAGETTAVAGSARSSRGFRLHSGPAPEVRIFIGAMGPTMVELAAEVADGLIVTWLSPRVLADFRARFSGAVERNGRDPGRVALAARVYVALTDTPEEAREEVRQELVEYLVSPPYGRYFSSVGFGSEVERVNDAFRARDRMAAIRAVSDRLLDDVLVVGRTAADVREALLAYHTAGADEIIVQPVPAYRRGNPDLTIRTVAEALEPRQR